MEDSEKEVNALLLNFSNGHVFVSRKDSSTVLYIPELGVLSDRNFT